MPQSDLIAFLSLIVALSAYVAVIRLRLIDKIAPLGPADPQKARLKRIAKWLTLADAPLTVSAAFLYFYGFWDSTLGKFFCGPAPEWMKNWSIYLFTFAGVALIGHHLAAWVKSVRA